MLTLPALSNTDVLRQALWGAAWLLLLAWCAGLGFRLRALARVSTIDPLTGLLSGRCFEAERWPAAMRSTSELAVVYIDLDNLKQKNDRLGRSCGDRYIASAAAALRRACRRGIDEVFRLHTAGDEFVVLVRGPEAVQADIIASNIVVKLHREGISASVGAAWTASVDHRERADLLAVAERAMRQAKTDGKGRAVVVEQSDPRSMLDADDNQSVPAPIEDTHQPLRHQIATPVRRQVRVLLAKLTQDAFLAFPGHRISLHIVRELPPLAVDEGRFLLAVATLLLHVASMSKHVHITAGVGRRAGLEPQADEIETPMLRVCFEFSPERTVSRPFLLELCRRTCVADGGAWLAQDRVYCLAWPVLYIGRQQAERPVASSEPRQQQAPEAMAA